jgi:ketosteroid isomerase-like protein
MTNREILEKANQAFSKGGYQEFLTYCTEDTKWTFVGDCTLDGKDKVREYLSAAYGESTLRIERYFEEGENLIAIGWIHLADKDGKITTSPVCDVWKFRSGKIARLIRSFASFMVLHLPWQLTVRTVENMRTGLVFLTGNAAHAMTLYGGKGANAGIQEVQNLAWRLAGVLMNNTSDELSDTYDIERQPVGAYYATTTGELQKKMI